MKAVVLTKHGAPENLVLKDWADPPPPGPGEVIVGIAATGVNFSDIAARLGVYPRAPKPPSVLGVDIAGFVSEVGSGVQTLAVGDRVFGVTRYGGYAERANTLAANLALLPARLTMEQGAAIPINYSAAWIALVSYGAVELTPGASVLIHAAAGGVGVAATQIAKRYGAEVWGTASPAKHDLIRGLGVDHAVDYRSPGWERALPPFDVVLDPIGGSSWRTSYSLLRTGGRLVIYGLSAAIPAGRRDLRAFVSAAVTMPRKNLIRQMDESKSVMGLMVPAVWDDRGNFQSPLTPLLPLIEDGTIEPLVDRTFTLDQAPEAHTYIAERRNVGKVVLVPAA